MRRPALQILFVLSTIAFPALARAWTQLHPGVTYKKEVRSGPNRIYVTRIDLASERLRVRATRPATFKRTTSQFAAAYRCQIAINGDWGIDSVLGLALGHGEKWPGSTERHGSSWIAVGRDNRADVGDPWGEDGVEPWFEDVVGGQGKLVWAGEVHEWVKMCTDYTCGQRHPRTAVGLTSDRRRLILVVVDGRSPASVGMTFHELANVMKGFDAHWATSLDGGGSSTMYVRKLGGVQNVPSDGTERPRWNHLGIQVVEPYGTLKGHVRDREGSPIANARVALSTGQSRRTDRHGYFGFRQVERGDLTMTVTRCPFRDREGTLYVTAADVTRKDVTLNRRANGSCDDEDDPGGDPNDVEDDETPPDAAGEVDVDEEGDRDVQELESGLACNAAAGRSRMPVLWALFLAAGLLIAWRRRKRICDRAVAS